MQAIAATLPPSSGGDFEYRLPDAHPSPTQFQLRLTDLNGVQYHSEVRALGLNGNLEEPAIRFDASSDQFVVDHLQWETEQIKARIVNLEGRIIRESTFRNGEPITLSSEGIPVGAYVLVISNTIDPFLQS